MWLRSAEVGDPSSIPGSGRSAAEGVGYPLQYSLWGCKELDRTAPFTSLHFYN